jgi:hypothetical protein
VKWDRYRYVAAGIPRGSGTVTGGCECSGLSQGRESKVVLERGPRKDLDHEFPHGQTERSPLPQTPETMISSV